ncbi:MAG: GNAT family N-acetyltransferase [Melioribacteraceae bacterium]|nr:GNAT family N-acetyltransferase [Melioribacteraceae bacterium]
MKIIPYSEEWREEWDNFVLSSNNGTMFHLQKFFDYHQTGKFQFNHLMFVENDKLVAVLPGSLKDRIFESPIGASYGSIVIGDYKFKYVMEIISTLLDYGKANNYKEIILTAAPMIYETYQNQNLEFALLWQGFSYELHYISSAIKLDKERDIIQRFQPTVRRNIRKTIKNQDIRVEVNDRYDQFYPILLENKARHDVKPTHSYDDLLKLKQLLPNSLMLFMVYLKDRPIGGSLMFYPNKNVALCFYNMLLYDYADYKPIHRVMYEVVKYCTDAGFAYVDIGVSQDTKAENPMTPSMSLIDFKEKFDAKTIMRNTLHIKL